MKMNLFSLFRILGLLIYIACVLHSPEAESSTKNIRFQRVNIDDGLSQKTVNAIFQDSYGYIWIGTQEGLNRYDGNNFKVYQPIYNDPLTISSGWVSSITEDNDGNLWVGTKVGVNVLDRKQNDFTRYTANNDVNSINDKVVRVVHKAKNGTMWVATRKGLNKFISKEKRFKHLNFFGHDAANVIDIFAVAEDITGALWLGTNGQGLLRFDPETEQLTVVATQFTTQKGFDSIGIRSLFIDDEQVLWIGSIESGLYKLDLKQPKAESMEKAITRVESFASSSVLSVAQDSHKTLWFGTNAGLYYRNSDKLSFSAIGNNSVDKNNLATLQVLSMFSDSSGVFWVGTFNGLNKWNTRTSQFDHFYKNSIPGKSLTSNNITMLGSGTSGLLYVGSNDGVDILDPNTGKVSSLPIETTEHPGLKEKRVMSFAYVSEQEVWFGYRASGATKYNPLENTYVHYTHDKSDPKSLGHTGVTNILHAKDGTLWFGTFGGGISRYNRSANNFTSYAHDPTDISTLSSNNVFSMHEANDGSLWIGTWESGLNVFVPATGTSFRIQRKDNDPKSLGTNRIVSILEDNVSNIWVSTHGGGLNILGAAQREQGNIEFQKLDSANGMPSNVVYGLLEDDNGFIWGSTNKGIVKIARDTKDVTIYNESQGLQSNEFNSGAHHKDADGYFYFGGTNGVTRFKPRNIKPNPFIPRISFTNFQRLNKFSSIENSLNENGNIEVFYTDYLIGFEFAALDFVSPKDNQYMYMLEGFDKDWIDVRNVPRATYTNLPSGKYDFRVTASNSDGIWNKEGKSITLRVKPAPWFSWWAYTMYSALLIIAAFYWYRSYLRKANQRHQYQVVLEEEVGVRTAELQSANEQLLKASITDQLSGLHNRRYLSDVMTQRLEDISRRFGQAILDDRMSSHGGPRLMALMFDLDGFKPVNDNYGHDAGDKVIIQVANIIKNESRVDDVVIRWGGDEFMAVAEVNNLEEGYLLAERIRVAIASHRFDVGLSNKFHLSSSLGFAMYPFHHYAPHSISWDQVHLLADHALYKSKAAGGNTWSGIIQVDKELPFSKLNSLLPNVDKAFEQKDIFLLERQNIIQ